MSDYVSFYPAVFTNYNRLAIKTEHAHAESTCREHMYMCIQASMKFRNTGSTWNRGRKQL